MIRGVRVVSFNVRTAAIDDGENRWSNRKEAFLKMVASINADILCVQEAVRPQMDAIRERFPQYKEWGCARDDGNYQGEYCSVFYLHDRFSVDESRSLTFWLSETPSSPSRGWGAACNRICTNVVLVEQPSQQAISVFNTHLDHLSPTARENSVRLILQRMKSTQQDKLPVIITGDFNCQDSERPYQLVIEDRELGMKDCAMTKTAGVTGGSYHHMNGTSTTVGATSPTATAVLALKPCMGGTFHGFKGRGSGTDRIDFIFVNQRHWTVLRCYADQTQLQGRYPSDHFPVVAELCPNYAP